MSEEYTQPRLSVPSIHSDLETPNNPHARVTPDQDSATELLSAIAVSSASKYPPLIPQYPKYTPISCGEFTDCASSAVPLSSAWYSMQSPPSLHTPKTTASSGR